ncbi:DUF6238 family protein [Streptomyces albidoflavus]|uniref:Uncharacterized protein n=1 Tax=Streptomyces wadayamensis TaxID=141454 RepID=A0ABR4S6W5_9ACTN|nr:MULTISPECIES: DUF6238 family protein [Streptomyces]KDR60935.1 hypothetical protein DC60_02825 [Streptomyces wadayamensis]QXQ25867.1 hypothetical protein STALF2_14650 [Streptomyces albidoflavus]QXQ31796.1 hypothetical protein STALF4_14700 [Streptomyces albidoflavus]
MTSSRRLSVTVPHHTGPERRPSMTTVAAAQLPPDEYAARSDLDRLHADALDLARRTARMAGALDHGHYSAAGGRARAAVAHLWRASEELHGAFHSAPPRCAGPEASLPRLCGRRMRYLAARIARRA